MLAADDSVSFFPFGVAFGLFFGVAPPPSPTPPGWYPYPDGTMRWWDGARWTEHQPQ